MKCGISAIGGGREAAGYWRLVKTSGVFRVESGTCGAVKESLQPGGATRSDPAASEGSHGGKERPAGAISRPGRPKRFLVDNGAKRNRRPKMLGGDNA